MRAVMIVAALALGLTAGSAAAGPWGRLARAAAGRLARGAGREGAAGTGVLARRAGAGPRRACPGVSRNASRPAVPGAESRGLGAANRNTPDAPTASRPRSGRRARPASPAGAWSRRAPASATTRTGPTIGDRAGFAWRHKGSLAVGATLAAFLANPAAFLDRAVDVATRVIAGRRGPSCAPADLGRRIGRGIVAAGIAGLMIVVVMRAGRRRPHRRRG